MIVLVCMSTLVSAQQYLYIKKKGEMPAERLSVHDVIKLRTENGDDWIKGRIQAIAKESLTLNDQVFPYQNIEGIRTYNSLVKVTGTAIWGAGVFFSSIAFINRLANGDAPLLRTGQIIFGTSMVAGGALVSWMARSTYRTSKGYYFEVIDLNESYAP
tara:strand:- start:411 stop:884 length:474 start_codon:yes stop_codon:yes gene_type:complete